LRDIGSFHRADVCAIPPAAESQGQVPLLMWHGGGFARIDKSPMFSAQLANNRKMAELAKAAGGSIEIVSLPELGIKGNSHFPMMEKEQRRGGRHRSQMVSNQRTR